MNEEWMNEELAAPSVLDPSALSASSDESSVESVSCLVTLICQEVVSERPVSSTHVQLTAAVPGASKL